MKRTVHPANLLGLSLTLCLPVGLALWLVVGHLLFLSVALLGGIALFGLLVGIVAGDVSERRRRQSGQYPSRR